jgi:hypothetical protein
MDFSEISPIEDEESGSIGSKSTNEITVNLNITTKPEDFYGLTTRKSDRQGKKIKESRIRHIKLYKPGLSTEVIGPTG